MKKWAWLLSAFVCLSATNVFAQSSDVSSTASQGTDTATAAAPAAAPVAQNQAAKDANDPSKVLPQEIVDRFKAVRSDPAPAALIRDAHYWVSNENAHYVWYPHIKDIGGVIAGVGTDQVYMLAAWSNASVIIPMDFDRMITNLHFAYGAAFLASENIEEFRTYWKRDNAEKMLAALKKYFPTQANDAMKAWKSGTREVNGRLNRVTKKYTKLLPEEKQLNVPTFITDEGLYKRIRQLWQNNRVFPVCGDLTGDKAMLDIAKALKDSGMEMTILYPSNAEHYFEYNDTYRRNIIQMPFSKNSQVLRTRQMRFLGLAEPEDYHYNMQTGENFKIWLETTQIKDQYAMLRRRAKTDTEGLSRMERVPDPSKKPPKIAPMPK